MSDDEDKKRKPIPLSALMTAASVPMPASPAAPGQEGGKGGFFDRGEAVRNSRDLERILALPSRDPLDLDSTRAEAMHALITERYTNGVQAGGFPNRHGAAAPCECREIDPRRFVDGAIGCVTSLLPLQVWTLYEMGLAGGAIGNIPVGAGKTILNILSVYALGAKNALVLIPSNLLAQFWDDYRLLAEHFRVPSVWIEGLEKGREIPGEPKIWVLPYGLLSRPKNSAYIDILSPDAIICDEADKLADIRNSATARRVLRYYVEAEAKGRRVAFAAWTGSITDKKLSEFVHLVVMALKENSPVPLDPREATSWGQALDVSEMPAPMGALRLLCEPEDFLLEDEVKIARRGFNRRLVSTLGIIATSENDVEVTGDAGTLKGTKIDIVFAERPPPIIPPMVQAALDSARGFVRPDKMFGAPGNEELESPMEKARTIMEIASGVMNVWEFVPTTPDRKKFVTHACGKCHQFNSTCMDCIMRSVAMGGVLQENSVIDEWYIIRSEWNKAVRGQTIAGVQYMDSPYLCEEAAARAWGDIPKDGKPEWPIDIWPYWRDIRKKVRPRPKSIRVHDYVVQDALDWAEDHKGIIWYSLVEFGRWAHELSKGAVPMYGGGHAAARSLKHEKGGRAILASIDSHGRGRNGLQFLFHEQLVAQLPSSSRRWEQLLGRLIRRGQRSENVITYIYLHIPELRDAIDQALSRSEYVGETWGMQLKLLKGWNKHMVKK